VLAGSRKIEPSWEKKFVCVDLGTQVKAVVEEFAADEEKRKCKACYSLTKLTLQHTWSVSIYTIQDESAAAQFPHLDTIVYMDTDQVCWRVSLVRL
jgi:hypothetical protein